MPVTVTHHPVRERGQAPPSPAVRAGQAARTPVPADRVLALQRAAGNRATSRVLARAMTHQEAMKGAPSRTERVQVLSGNVSAEILEEITAILEAAETSYAQEQKGEFKTGSMYDQLKKIAEGEGVKKHDPGSRGTYGISGATFFPGSPIFAVQGSREYRDAVTARSEGQTIDLGSRSTGLHDEMLHISERPGMEAVFSTQRCCIFCYGLLHRRGYQHGPLRSDNVFPQKWKHPNTSFRLDKTAKVPTDVSDAPRIKISSATLGEAYYRVA